MAEQLIVRLTGIIDDSAVVLDFTIEDLLKRMCEFTDDYILESKAEHDDGWNMLATLTLCNGFKKRPLMVLSHRHIPDPIPSDQVGEYVKNFFIYELLMFIHDESEESLRKDDIWCIVRFPHHKENPYVQ